MGGVETNLGRSKLRAAAEGLLEGDARYRGKKGSRRTLDQDLDEPLDQDMKEHMQAELGHMFGGGDVDDDEEEDEVMEEVERVGKKGLTEEKSDGEFSFNPNTNFSDYGEEMEHGSEDEEDENEDEKPNDEDSEEESEEEDDEMEEEEGP